MLPDWVMAQAVSAAAGPEDAAAFEAQLLEQSTFITLMYGAVFVVGFILLAVFTMRIQSRPLDWREPLERLAGRPWSWRAAASMVAVLFLVQVAAALVYGRLEDSHLNENIMLVAQSLLFHGLCFVLIVRVMRKDGIDWTAGFGRTGARLWMDGAWGVLVLTGTMPLILAYNVAAHVVMGWWGLDPQVQEVARMMAGAQGWMARAYFVFLAVVAAPVVEELLFRGVLLPVLARHLGVRPALVLVALLFAVVHGLAMPAAVIFFILSIAFSLAYIYRGSLVAPVVMHAVFNGMTMLVLLRLESN